MLNLSYLMKTRRKNLFYVEWCNWMVFPYYLLEVTLMSKIDSERPNQRPVPNKTSKPAPHPSPEPTRRIFNTPERRSVDRNTNIDIKPPVK